MSTIAAAVLATFSVVYSLRITSVQQDIAAGSLHNHRDKDENLRHRRAAVERRSLRGRGFFDCEREKALIEVKNEEIRKHHKTLHMAHTFRRDAQKDTHLPHYLNYAHYQMLNDELKARFRDLLTHIEKKQSPLDFLCHTKKGVIRRQGEVIAKYVEIIEFNIQVVQSLQRKVIADQTRSIDECEAMLSNILAKEEEFGIQPQQSRGKQASVEAALRDALSKDIETLKSVKKDFDKHAQGGRRVIGYQKKVIDKYKNVLVVSFVRLKAKSEPNAKIQEMQAALENLLNAGTNKLEAVLEDIEAPSGEQL